MTGTEVCATHHLHSAFHECFRRHDLDAGGECACADEQFVLIGFVQFIQLPDCMALAAFVRLGRIDGVCDLLTNAPDEVLPKGWVILGVAADRIIDMPIRFDATASVEHELIGNLIERASEILDYVGGYGRDAVGNRWALAT